VKRDSRVLWSGGAERPMAPASLTKMMTALLVIERGRLDEVVTVSRAAARETGARLGLRAGDQLRAHDLLAAVVVRSANDACRALADHDGPGFVARMNQRALALGLARTRFVDPCGHDRPGQYSTAADLARLAEQVMRHPEYVRLSRISRMRVATLDERRKFSFQNTNALIGRYDGALGVKTGFTAHAGHCLVALAEKDGVRVLVVLLNAPNRWWNAVGLLDRAFEARSL
jgi:D-alanyl-D-alanine carboxypeptidase (penicillin-binding protein 5/6)